MASHCLVCNLTLQESHEQYNIFSSVDLFTNKEESGRPVHTTLFSTLAQALNRPLNSVLLHSQVICVGCYSKVTEYVITRNKLQKLELDLRSEFDQTFLSQSKPIDIIHNVTSSHSGKQCIQFNDHGQLIPSDPTTHTLPVTASSPGQLVIADTAKGKNSSLNKKLQNVVDNVSDVGRQYTCGKCGKIFSSNSHWVEHMLIHIDAKPHKCSRCNKQFRTVSSLKVHERSHTGVKPYDCKLCSKSFSEKHYLTEHLLVHADHKAFKCSVCNREFSRRKDMTTHMKMHSEDRPHSCPHCPKKFVVRSRLNRHLKTHSMDRPYQCKTCLKSFVRHNDFKVHERLHTGVKPFKCTNCNRCFSSLSNCRSHERRHKISSKAKMTSGTSSVQLAHIDSKYASSAVHQNQAEVLQKENAVIASKEINNEETSQMIIPSAGAAVFSISSSQPDELSVVSNHLSALTNFDDEAASSKPVVTPNSALPLDSDLSNITLSSDEQNINCQQSLVLMQFPLMTEPPPLLLYSTTRHSDDSVQLAPSTHLDNSSDNTLTNQTHILRWDNMDEVDNVNLYSDNSNWSMLAHSLF